MKKNKISSDMGRPVELESGLESVPRYIYITSKIKGKNVVSSAVLNVNLSPPSQSPHGEQVHGEKDGHRTAKEEVSVKDMVFGGVCCSSGEDCDISKSTANISKKSKKRGTRSDDKPNSIENSNDAGGYVDAHLPDRNQDCESGSDESVDKAIDSMLDDFDEDGGIDTINAL